MSQKCSLRFITTVTCSGDLIIRANISEDDAEVIRSRTGTLRIDSVCSRHWKDAMDYFPLRHTSCCQLVTKHENPPTKRLKEVELQLVRDCKSAGVVLSAPLIPGMKLCQNCLTKLNKDIRNSRQASQNSQIQGQADPGASGTVQPGTDEPTSNKQQEDAGLAMHCSNEPTTSQGGTRKSSSGRTTFSTKDFGKEASNTDAGTSEEKNCQDLDDIFLTPPCTALNDLNKCFTFLGLEEVDSRKLRKSKTYPGERLDDITRTIVSKMEKASERDLSYLNATATQDYQEIIKQLQDRYQSTTDKAIQVQILSVLPASYSLQKVCDTIGATMFMAKKVKALVKDGKEVLPCIQPRLREGFDENLKAKIILFYKDNSRQLPGKKDYVSVREDGKRVQKQKMLVLMTLKELHTAFLKENPHNTVSFSKFAELRPKECVLAGANGTHSVCVCVYHENFSLLIESLGLTKEVDGKVKCMSISDVLHMALCENTSKKCWLSKCSDCPGEVHIRQMMEDHFDECFQKKVEYKKWLSTDRSTLETCSVDVVDFIDEVTDMLPTLLHHHFIFQEQAKYLKSLKEGLKSTECIVIGDFSENYTVVQQDAIQGVHWDKEQITLHPFVCYYLNLDGILEVLNYVVISDYLKHETLAVSAFQDRLVPCLKEKIPNLECVHYFSDGCSSQYKNRFNAFNLRMHKEDFGVEAVWHFFASCHGKGPCDGLAGTMKRLAALESLRRARREGIITAQQFYEWSKLVFASSTTVELVTIADIEEFRNRVGARYVDTQPADGISSCHCMIALSKNVLCMKLYSNDTEGLYIYYGELNSVEKEDVHGFVIISLENQWALASVSEKLEDENFKVCCLERVGKSNNFKALDDSTSIICSITQIIAIANVEVVGDSTFKLPKKYVTFANAEQTKRHPPPPKPAPRQRGQKRKAN